MIIDPLLFRSPPGGRRARCWQSNRPPAANRPGDASPNRSWGVQKAGRSSGWQWLQLATAGYGWLLLFFCDFRVTRYLTKSRTKHQSPRNMWWNVCVLLSKPTIFSHFQEKPRVWGCSMIMFLMSSTMAGTCFEQQGSGTECAVSSRSQGILASGYR